MTNVMGKIQRQYAKERIRQHQIVQHEIDQIRISLVHNQERALASDFFADLIKFIECNYQDSLGREVKLTVQEVQALPRGSNTGMSHPLLKSLIGQRKGLKLRLCSKESGR